MKGITINARDWQGADKLWSAKAIARSACVSVDTVVRWHRDDPSCPITKIGGRYFVLEHLLVLWLTSKPTCAD